ELCVFLEKVGVSVSLAHRFLQSLHPVFRCAGRKDERIAAADESPIESDQLALEGGFGKALDVGERGKAGMSVLSSLRDLDDGVEIHQVFFDPFRFLVE